MKRKNMDFSSKERGQRSANAATLLIHLVITADHVIFVGLWSALNAWASVKTGAYLSARTATARCVKSASLLFFAKTVTVLSTVSTAESSCAKNAPEKLICTAAPVVDSKKRCARTVSSMDDLGFS
jgi:hypothetical protein